MNAENIAATPPETMSYCGDLEYLSLVYNFSFLKKLQSNDVKKLLNRDVVAYKSLPLEMLPIVSILDILTLLNLI
jgi:hypothetical protein